MQFMLSENCDGTGRRRGLRSPLESRYVLCTYDVFYRRQGRRGPTTDATTDRCRRSHIIILLLVVSEVPTDTHLRNRKHCV